MIAAFKFQIDKAGTIILFLEKNPSETSLFQLHFLLSIYMKRFVCEHSQLKLWEEITKRGSWTKDVPGGFLSVSKKKEQSSRPAYLKMRGK